LILVRYPCIRLLFQHGNITPHDTELIARSVLWYSTAIWAFSLLQIVNRAYYALHDTTTPLVMAVVNIAINLIVELPLVWVTGLGEAGMAVGTAASFGVQAVVMLWMLDRRIGGLGLERVMPAVAKMFVAMIVMIVACVLVTKLPFYPRGPSRLVAACQLVILVGIGALSYCTTCSILGVEVLGHILPGRLRRRQERKAT
jgi:putative peptidoglycan lipid II flippase